MIYYWFCLLLLYPIHPEQEKDRNVRLFIQFATIF